MSFESLGLRAELLSAIASQGYTTPTPIQAQAIPVIFEGCDLLAGAQTGTGKTAAFALPIVQRLSETIPKDKRRRPRALVLVPTRELAAQVSDQMQIYGRRLSLRSTMIYGGVNIQAQIERLHRGVDIVVATPGRLLDHAERGTISLAKIEFLVLDEADRMLDLGFIDDILRVAAFLPAQHQSLLFSATFSQSIKELADELLDQPRLVEVARRKITAEAVTQVVHPVERIRKTEMLMHLIRTEGWQQVLVFARTRYGADKLTAELLAQGIKASAIHSNKSQSVRTRTLAEFKQGSIPVLVATDVAARGLDIERLPLVVNFDLPQVPEDYVHRIGRTGRAGEKGLAVSLLCPEEQSLLAAIEKLLKFSIPKKTLPEFPLVGRKWVVKTKPAQKAAEPAGAKKPATKQTRGTAEKTPGRGPRAAAKPAAKPTRAAKPSTKTAAPQKASDTRGKRAGSARPAPKTGRRGGRS